MSRPTYEEVKDALRAWLENPDSALPDWASKSHDVPTEITTPSSFLMAVVRFWPTQRLKVELESRNWFSRKTSSGQFIPVKMRKDYIVAVHTLNRDGSPSRPEQIERLRAFVESIDQWQA